nr:amblin-like [Dermacentor andersoni]
MKFQSFCLVLLVYEFDVQAFLSKKKEPGACLKKPDPGPCKASKPSWYFEEAITGCKYFIYGGCNGNSNRFASEEKCVDYCLPKSRHKPVCSRKPKPIKCKSMLKYWYFNATENTCHRLEAGLCPTTGNMFTSCDKCMKRCSATNPLLPCSLEYKKLHNTVTSSMPTPTRGRPGFKPLVPRENLGQAVPRPEIGRPTNGAEWESTRL